MTLSANHVTPPDFIPPGSAWPEPMREAAVEPMITAEPSDGLLALILALLAPLFLTANTELGLARMAAIETMASYRARSQAELICITQIIAFGLAAMDSLRLSMLPELSISMKLRLRGCANALNRSSQQNTRALHDGRRLVAAAPVAPLATGPGTAEERFSDAKIRANLGDTERMLRDIQTQLTGGSMQRRPGDAAPGTAAQRVAPAAVARPMPGKPGTGSPLAGSSVAATMAGPLAALAGFTPDLPGAEQPADVVAPVIAQPGIAGLAGATSLGTVPGVAAPAVGQPVSALAGASPTLPVGASSPQLSEKQVHNLMWSSAMVDVAGEMTGGKGPGGAPPLSEIERMWVDALGSAARHLAGAALGNGPNNGFAAALGAIPGRTGKPPQPPMMMPPRRK